MYTSIKSLIPFKEAAASIRAKKGFEPDTAAVRHIKGIIRRGEAKATCRFVGIPDENRGMLVCANIVLKNPASANDELAKSIQDWFKQVAAPYKYPRVIKFHDVLPKTETGKIQRFKLTPKIRGIEPIQAQNSKYSLELLNILCYC